MSRMKLEYTISDIREVEQDAYERGRRDALEWKPREDCISRTEALDALDWLPKHKTIGEGEWSIKENAVREMLGKLPSVKPSRATGKWIMADDDESICI